MLGIVSIGKYIPSERVNNLDFVKKFDVDSNFVKNKLGVSKRAKAEDSEDVVSMCKKAIADLQLKSAFELDEIDVMILITQSPEGGIPHLSAKIHGDLGMKVNCACFDVSLGCSGFVYGLSIIQSFMESNGFKKGLLLTCDPYSKIINVEDKNTSMLFGDAATASLIGDDAKFSMGKFTFGTCGNDWRALVFDGDFLTMNGRQVFNFAASNIPLDIKNNLIKNELDLDDIDLFLFHPGSKYIIETLQRKCSIESVKVFSDIDSYGNTVSSSIPLLLEEKFEDDNNNILISGFGVGLSFASTVLKRRIK